MRSQDVEAVVEAACADLRKEFRELKTSQAAFRRRVERLERHAAKDQPYMRQKPIVAPPFPADLMAEIGLYGKP